MSGFVYIIESASGFYKVGYSATPRKRLTMLRTSTHEALTLIGVIPGTIEHERELHTLLAPWRVEREWFKPCRAIGRLIAASTPVAPVGWSKTENMVAEVIRQLGGATKAAAQIGVSGPSVVLNWRKRNSVPAERVVRIHELTGISCHALRPDIFDGEAA